MNLQLVFCIMLMSTNNKGILHSLLPLNFEKHIFGGEERINGIFAFRIPYLLILFNFIDYIIQNPDFIKNVYQSQLIFRMIKIDIEEPFNNTYYKIRQIYHFH
ncbi:hypothetical protein pb186bvf_003071 [Paramecium bursaria]